MTQVFTTIDGFAHGTPVYGDLVAGWINMNNGSAGDPVRLHNGYGRGASALADPTDNPEREGTCFVRRDIFAEEVRVRAVMRKAAAAGVAKKEHLLRHGVYARITDGTITNANSRDVYIDNPTCYGFEVVKVLTGGFKLQLVRIVAGARTVLDSLSGDSFDGEWTNDHELILWCQTNGDGTVDLTAQIGGHFFTGTGGPSLPTGSFVGLRPGGPGHWGEPTLSADAGARTGTYTPQPPTNVFLPSPPGFIGGGGGGQFVVSDALTIFEYADVPANAITGTGRCGFRIDSERQVGAAQTYSKVTNFIVEDITDAANPSVSYRDEFTRVALARTESITDLHGTTGQVIADDYTTGRFAESIAAGFALNRDTSLEKAKLTNTISFGSGAVLDGTANAELTAQSWQTAFANGVPTGSSFQITVAVWMKVDTNQTATIFASADGGSIANDEWEFQWEDAGGSTFRLRMVTATGTYASDAISESGFVGTTKCYVMTYQSNADRSTGTGRVRFYTGAHGQVTLHKEVALPVADRPELGGDAGTLLLGGGVAGNVDGTLDGLSVWYRELGSAEVDQVANQAFGQQAEIEDIPNFAHGCDFETSASDDFLPFFPPALSQANNDHLWLGGTGVTTGTGLLPDTTAKQVNLDQRGEESGQDQTRSMSVTLGGPLSTFGIILRATQPTVGHDLGPGCSGYLIEVGVGSPTAPLNLYRVVNGALTRLASQASTNATVEDVEFSFQGKVEESGGTHLSAQLGGSDVTWQLDGQIGPEAALSLDSKSVVDLGTDRITSGPTSGFTSQVDTDPTLMEDWAYGSIAAVAGSASSVSAGLPQEGDNPSGSDLATAFSAEYRLTSRLSSVRRAEFLTLDGHAKRWMLDSYEPRIYQLSAAGLTTAERDTFQAFFDAHMPLAQGGYVTRRIPFTWNASTESGLPGEPDGLWVFGAQVAYGRIGTAHTVVFSIEEVLPAVEAFNPLPTVPPDPPVIDSVSP